ncbi:MAG TPA: NAD(P)/FAD-dependent oxidoreductase [Myxococcota bacterium]|nr:NAD(P)/FAD-dependent oxidoreductase [Myxococcota bacterium]
MPDTDVLIVGAGHNGLTAANLLARQGVDVLCVEKNRYVGGMASTVELFDGYQFEIAGSVVFPIAPYVVADLDLENCGLEPIEREIMSSNLGDPGEPVLHMYTDPMKMLRHLAEDHGADAAEGFMKLGAYVQGPAAALDRFNPCAPPRTLGQIFGAAKSVEDRNALRLLFFGSVMDVVDRFFPDPNRHKVIRTMLAFLAINSTFRGPYTPGSAACLFYALAAPENGWVMHKLRGGIGSLTKGMARKLEERGGRILLHRTVERILVENGRAVGVELADGERITARKVVSNLDPTSTFLRLVGEEHVPDDYVAGIRAIDHRGAYVQIQVALSELPEFAGEFAWLNEGDYRASCSIFNSPELLQENWVECRRKQVPRDPCVGFQIPSVLDPELAPPGRHAGTLYAMYFPCEAPREQHGHLKDEMAERVFDKVARYAPNFRDTILHQATFAPYHYESMFGCTGGDFCHGLIHPEQLVEMRPIPGWNGGYRTPIEDLYLCGASCHPGPGVVFLPGYNGAHVVLEDLGIEVARPV